MSSDMLATWPSIDGKLLRSNEINLLISKIYDGIFLLFKYGPLCLIKPSKVSIVRFNPSKL